MRGRKKDLNHLKHQAARTRLQIDKARLAAVSDQNPTFEERVSQMSATEYAQYAPPQTPEELREMGKRIAMPLKVWLREFGAELLLAYDQNLAAGQPDHDEILWEWGSALVDEDSYIAFLEKRDLWPVSRFHWDEDIGGNPVWGNCRDAETYERSQNRK